MIKFGEWRFESVEDAAEKTGYTSPEGLEYIKRVSCLNHEEVETGKEKVQYVQGGDAGLRKEVRCSNCGFVTTKVVATTA